MTSQISRQCRSALFVPVAVLAGFVLPDLKKADLKKADAKKARATTEAVTAVKGSACAYLVNVGLFGGPQGLRGCGQTGSAPPSAASPSVSLPPAGSATPVTQTDNDGAKAVYGPAVIHGGRWPCDDTNCPSSGPQSGPMAVSTRGTAASGTVTSSADISLFETPPTVTCDSAWKTKHPGKVCKAVGGQGPPPVEADSMHVECSASETSTTGKTTFVNASVAHTTDAEGNPVDVEAIPNDPPPNYTEHGVITNVGDVFTVVFNEQIVNPDGSLTVNGVHMYLFGPVAVGELVRGQVRCGVTPSPLPTSDTRPPTIGTKVVEPVGPEDPTPKSPRKELVGVFDTGGLRAIEDIKVTNGTVQVGQPTSTFPYLQFAEGQTGPLQVTATRTEAAEAANLPLTWSFVARDMAGNTSVFPQVVPGTTTTSPSTSSTTTTRSPNGVSTTTPAATTTSRGSGTATGGNSETGSGSGGAGSGAGSSGGSSAGSSGGSSGPGGSSGSSGSGSGPSAQSGNLAKTGDDSDDKGRIAFMLLLAGATLVVLARRRPGSNQAG